MALAEAEGIELTKEEAEVYMDEFKSFDLDEEQLAKAAGGLTWCINCDERCTEQTKFC